MALTVVSIAPVANSTTPPSPIAVAGPQPAVAGCEFMKTYQAVGSVSSGTGSAVINVEGSNDNVNFDVIGTITLTLGTTPSSDAFASNDRFGFIRANATTLTGTGASYNLTYGR